MSHRFASKLAWRLSPQIYAWRVRGSDGRILPAFLEAGIDDAVAAGYSGVEVNLSALEGPGRVRALAEILGARGIASAAVFVTVRADDSEDALHEIADRAAPVVSLGCRILNVAVAPSSPGEAPGSFARTIAMLSRLGTLCAARGVQLQWHPHDEDLRGGVSRLDEVLESTSREHVGVCLDLGWVLQAERDPVSLIRRCRGRIGIVHLRDRRDAAWCQALGEGDLDLEASLAELDRGGFDGWLSVELWFDRATRITRSLRENAAASAAALRRALPGSAAAALRA